MLLLNQNFPETELREVLFSSLHGHLRLSTVSSRMFFIGEDLRECAKSLGTQDKSAYELRIIVSSILKGVNALKAWGSSAGMMMASPIPRLKA
jgi:hypothetical protein